MSLAKKYLVASFIVCLHFAAQVRYLTFKSNRLCFWWSRLHAVALVADLVLVPLVFVLVAVALERLARRLKRPGLKRLLDHVFLVALLSGLLAAFPSLTLHGHPTLTKLLWLGGMAAVGFSLACPRSRLPGHASTFCLVFSPVTFIFCVQILSWPDLSERPRTPDAPRAAAKPATPVFIFVCDEWSRPRSMANGEFRPCFRSIRTLANQSVVFRRALSPDDDTSISIPRLIYQTDLSYKLRGSRIYWQADGEEMLSTALPSLFRQSQERGYNTYLVGWAVAYSRFLGDQVDYCHSYRNYPEGENLPAEMAQAVFRNMQFWTDPISQRLWEPVNQRIVAAHYVALCRDFEKEMMQILGQCPRNTLALFHLPLPHDPFVWDEDGTYLGLTNDPLAVGYERHLRYLDLYMGRIFERLRGVEKFDDALIIVTADHSWRFDKEPAMRQEEAWTRSVPLIIKLPGQRRGVVIDEGICTNQLGPLFDAVFAGERDPERLTALLRRIASGARSDPPGTPPNGRPCPGAAP